MTGGGESLALKAKYLKLAAITAICMWVFVGCRQRTTQLSAASVWRVIVALSQCGARKAIQLHARCISEGLSSGSSGVSE